MIFPFSFWGPDPFAGLIQTLILGENFTNWFNQWSSVVQTLQLTENFTGYFDSIWNARTETLQIFDNFESGW